MSEALKSVIAPIHPAGWAFIAIGAAIAVLLSWVWPPLGWIGAAATAWVTYFFRDPERVTPTPRTRHASPSLSSVM